ncbi:hypothetical protein [Novosphingobium sp.]|uniref:hypothetical protein n=1 Tax=Novosphingobium sp. TaxID=1874826 RepID=UPI00262D9C5B|nr:hypothetical protein [Novosphingobium sp.]
MYELLFRSRWYAFAWALLMAVSAIAFTTTGAGAWWSQTGPNAHASEEARETEFQSWAEDDKRRIDEGGGFDPSSPEQVHDGPSPHRNAAVSNTAPNAPEDEVEDEADARDGQ